MIIKECLWCGTVFEPKNNKIFCSVECSNAYDLKMKKGPDDKICQYCGMLFKPTARNQKYCSLECRTIVDRANKNAHQKRYMAKKALQIEMENKAIEEAMEEEKPKKRPKPKKTLQTVASEARAAGMSYGKYVQKFGG